jgi:hypothetical protein
VGGQRWCIDAGSNRRCTGEHPEDRGDAQEQVAPCGEKRRHLCPVGPPLRGFDEASANHDEEDHAGANLGNNR